MAQPGKRPGDAALRALSLPCTCISRWHCSICPRPRCYNLDVDRFAGCEERCAMSYDVYVNLKYDDAVVRRIVDLAPQVDFFGDGETLTFPPSDFALHNDRYRGTPEHQFIID